MSVSCTSYDTPYVKEEGMYHLSWCAFWINFPLYTGAHTYASAQNLYLLLRISLKESEYMR